MTSDLFALFNKAKKVTLVNVQEKPAEPKPEIVEEEENEIVEKPTRKKIK